MATLTVGAGKQYATIAAAVRATRDGDTVLVQAGTYYNDFFAVTTKITLQSVGGLAVIAATVEPPNGKGIIVADNDLTVDGFGFTGAAVNDGNGAGIRYDLGNLVVRNSVFWDNQDGILANGWATGTILIENSEFSHNGAGDGYTHNLYVGEVASLIVRNSYFHDAVVGHEIKSRARSTTITGNRIQDNALGNGSYSIDIPNGGVALVQDNIIEKGPKTENWVTIHFGGENGAPYSGSRLTVTGNTIINDNPNGYLLNNSAGTSPVTLSNNQIWGFAADHIALGTVTQTANTTLATRPTLDLTSRAPTVLPPPVLPIIVPVPITAVLQDFGTAGAVTRNGTILTVGTRGTFASLSAAMTVAKDGDTIQVAAGTYVNDAVTINKKVIIEGVGGIAHFHQDNMPGSKNGIFVISTDATLRNLEFSGAHNWDGRQGGVQVTAGKVTVVNSYFHQNDIGIVAGDNPDIALTIVDTELANNANPDRGTHNLTVGAVGSFVLRNSTVHGASSGHEVSSRAYNALIEGNRIYDGAGIPASFLLNLGQGGKVTVRNNILEKGADATNGILVHVGGEGLTYSNSDVQITNNTLITHVDNPDHPYTFFVVGDDAKGPHPATTVSNNTYMGGGPGSLATLNVTGTGTLVPITTTVDTTAPWSAARAPAAFLPVSHAPNTLTLRLSELRQETDAQFTVSVDGTVVGSGIVTASHAARASQAFAFTGWWGAGTHTVTVNAYNVTYGLGPAASNLWVDSIALDSAYVTPNQQLDRWSTTWSTTIFGNNRAPDFDRAFYLANNADVARSGADPLTHYLTIGWREGRDPNALFSTSYYLSHNADVAATGVNPLLHYEQTGWKEGRDPSGLFSVSSYLAANPDVAAANMDPLEHYIAYGRSEGRNLSPTVGATQHDPLVDDAWYLAQHPDVARAGLDPTANYHATGWKLGYDPNPWFDTSYYLLTYRDVAAAGMDPLLHYETYGWREGRDPSPNFSSVAYNASHPTTAGQVNPLMSFLASGAAPANPANSPYKSPEASLFDAAYYVAHNADVAAAQADPFRHFITNGWHENRNPSATFSLEKYLTANPDVRAANMDPLFHFATYGQHEGRAIFSV